MTKGMAIVGLLAAIVLEGVPVSAADAPSADAVLQRMKAVLEPEQPSVRKLVLRSTSPFRPESTQFVAGQARKPTPAGERVVTVVLPPSPEGARGTAWLIQAGKEETVQWLWLPWVARVRKLLPLPGYESFLGSDFTYADLGLVDLHATATLDGEETLGGETVYKVTSVPASKWFYARIVSYVAAASGFPRKREFYDPANQLWKVETFDRVTDIQGVPTVLHFRMDDVQGKVSSDIEVTGVRYAVDIPDALFAADQLPKTITAPIWQTLGPS